MNKTTKLKKEYLELINLVEEYKHNKENAESALHEEQWQQEIDAAEKRISEILTESTILDKK